MSNRTSNQHQTPAMTVSFFRIVCDSTGHECLAPQGTERISAAELHQAAIEIAREKLARRRHLSAHIVDKFEAVVDAVFEEEQPLEHATSGVLASQGPGHDV